MSATENGVREDRVPWPLEIEAPGVFDWTEDDFEALIETGAASRLGRIELRGGVIWRMNSIHVPHARMRGAVANVLIDALKTSTIDLNVLQEVTVRCPGYMPTPDIVTFVDRRQRKSVPIADVRLIVEIADTTLDDDLGDKRARYAAAGLAEYWVVDMPGRRILRFDAPGAAGFRAAPIVAAGERCESLTLAGVAIATADLPWD